MRFAILVLLLFAAPLRAEPPRVVTTIAPLYGIASDLLRGIAEPTLIVTKNADPHNFSLSPSQVSALLNADVVFAMGGGMEPWLGQLDLNPETRVVIFGNGFGFTSPPAPRALGLTARSLDQVTGDPEPATPDSFDPHVWLDEFRGNALVSASMDFLISRNLLDTGQRRQMMQNLRDSGYPSKQAVERLNNVAKALGDTPIVTTHDSLQYLDHYLRINIVGALSSVTGEQAGARSISRLTNIEGPVCLMIDITEDASDLTALFPGWTQVRYDPMGYEFAGEPNYLANLYLSIAEALEACIPES
ncbi:MAG: zinc ABC transporter substrate-binding protein [Rhodobacteraceae bacterium]|nr:zinc ABC transporter substrate-binding protein [Paracoccaceae bacterium]